VNKDQLKGKAKDIAGRVERQAGEWTGDQEAQVRGAAKQVEGKVQKAWGDLKDAAQKTADKEKDKEKEKEKEKELDNRPVHDSAEPAEDDIRSRKAS
jgi:uncharacterized protein YjbJ (UPF0337 family)